MSSAPELALESVALALASVAEPSVAELSVAELSVAELSSLAVPVSVDVEFEDEAVALVSVSEDVEVLLAVVEVFEDALPGFWMTAQLPNPESVTNWATQRSPEAPPVQVMPAGICTLMGSVPPTSAGDCEGRLDDTDGMTKKKY